MEVTSIQNGIIIDHVPAGTSLKVLEYLKIDPAKTKLALIMNADSKRYGSKDIIKIDALIDLDLDVLGYVDPDITVSIIKDGVQVEKKHPQLPKKLVNVLRCKNPRCITTTEPHLPAEFVLSDPEKHTYRCAYCDSEYHR